MDRSRREASSASSATAHGGCAAAGAAGPLPGAPPRSKMVHGLRICQGPLADPTQCAGASACSAPGLSGSVEAYFVERSRPRLFGNLGGTTPGRQPTTPPRCRALKGCSAAPVIDAVVTDDAPGANAG